MCPSWCSIKTKQFKVPSGILLASILLSLSPPGNTAPALHIENLQVLPGQEAAFKVSINDEVQGVCGLWLTLKYEEAAPAAVPPLILTGLSEKLLGSAFAGSLYASSSILNPETSLSYERRRRIAIAHAEPVDGPADVITLSFLVPENAIAGSTYSVIVEATAYDAYGTRSSVQPATALLRVISPPVQRGDVNGNGRLEVSDAVLTLRAAVGLADLNADQRSRADVDGNGMVQVGDAVAVLRLAVGLTGKGLT